MPIGGLKMLILYNIVEEGEKNLNNVIMESSRGWILNPKVHRCTLILLHNMY